MSAHLLCVAVADATLDPGLFRPKMLLALYPDKKKEKDYKSYCLSPCSMATTCVCSMQTAPRATGIRTAGQGTAAKFNYPIGVACCPDDRALVAEGHGRHLRQVSAGGAVTTFAGGGAVGSQDGQGTDGRAVHHVARDAAGNIRVSIRVVNRAANRVHTVTGGVARRGLASRLRTVLGWSPSQRVRVAWRATTPGTNKGPRSVGEMKRHHTTNLHPNVASVLPRAGQCPTLLRGERVGQSRHHRQRRWTRGPNPERLNGQGRFHFMCMYMHNVMW